MNVDLKVSFYIKRERKSDFSYIFLISRRMCIWNQADITGQFVCIVKTVDVFNIK